MGLVASDGNNTKERNTIRYTRIKFYNSEESLIDLFLKITLELFPNVKCTKRLMRKNFWVAETSNSLFATVCSNLGVISPSRKGDIHPILELEKKLIASFLRGYFDGDGSVYFKEKSDRCLSEIRFFSMDYTNIKRIHQMLLKLKINNRISKRRLDYSHFKTNNKLYYAISITDIASKILFCQIISSNHPLKKQGLEKIENYFKDFNLESKDFLYCPLEKNKLISDIKYIKELGGNFNRIKSGAIPMRISFLNKLNSFNRDIPKFSEDFVLERIKSINLISYDGPVYDITVDEEHNFLMENGIVSSNCVDLGKRLNCKAHMQELVRSRVCTFSEIQDVYYSEYFLQTLLKNFLW